jgi:hypothetical protein
MKLLSWRCFSFESAETDAGTPQRVTANDYHQSIIFNAFIEAVDQHREENTLAMALRSR